MSEESRGWTAMADIEIWCGCGGYIQVGDADSGIVICKSCGQKFLYTEYHVELVENKKNDSGMLYQFPC